MPEKAPCRVWCVCGRSSEETEASQNSLNITAQPNHWKVQNKCRVSQESISCWMRDVFLGWRLDTGTCSLSRQHWESDWNSSLSGIPMTTNAHGTHTAVDNPEALTTIIFSSFYPLRSRTYFWETWHESIWFIFKVCLKFSQVFFFFFWYFHHMSFATQRNFTYGPKESQKT